jgi:hypothetical protein
VGVVILFTVCDVDKSFAQRRKAAIYTLFKISKARLKTDKTNDYPGPKGRHVIQHGFNWANDYLLNTTY